MFRFGVRGAIALLLTLCASLLLLIGPAYAAVGGIIERTVPGTVKGGLNRITNGPDGNIWFTNPAANQIGRMTPAGAFTGFDIPTASSSPIDITTGPDGALWFTEYGDRVNGQIGRITTSGQITEFPVFKTTPGGALSHVYGITKGPDGALWFTTDCCDPANPGKIGRITTSGAVTLYPVVTGSTPTVGITTGPDGNLWYPVTTASGFDRIQRMSPSGQINADIAIPTQYSDPSRIVTGPDGNLWFTEQGAVPNHLSPGKIGRVTPSGDMTEFTTPNQNPTSNPAGIAVGPDGNLWYTEYSHLNMDFTQHGQNNIGRITTSGKITEFPIPTRYARADGITNGPDGGMYFTESPNDFSYGAIGRIQAVGPTITVRLRPRLTVRVKKQSSSRRSARKTTFATSGRLLLAAHVPSSACRGLVSIQIKHGTRTVSTRRLTLRANCTFRGAVSVLNSRLHGRGRNAIIVSFLGNNLLKPVTVSRGFA